MSNTARRERRSPTNSGGQLLGEATGQFVEDVIMTRTRQMIAAWQKSQGEPPTGYLTSQQLALLSQQARPALDRFDRAVARGQGKPAAKGAPAGEAQH
jgi:hypothetical protein